MARTGPHRRLAGDDGMSLLEVVIAAVILGILSTAVLGVIMQTQNANVDSRSRTAAASLAAREIDFVREEFARTTTAPIELAAAGVVSNPHPLPGQVAGQPLVVDSQRYTVTRSAAWNVTGPGRSACEGGSLVDHPTLGVTVSVSWVGMGSTKPVVSHIQLAPPKGTGVATTASFVAVRVVDSKGRVSPGRAVRVTGGAETRSGLTDDVGCAVVAVNPSTTGSNYTVRLTDTGYVDVNGSANPEKTTGSLLPGRLSSTVPFAYDRAATLTVRVVSPDGSLFPDGDLLNRAITVVATESTGASASRSIPVSSAVTTLSGLWPTLYGAYFGSAPPSDGYPTVTLAPGASGELDVVLELARAVVTGLPPGASTLRAVPSGIACTDPSARDVDPDGVEVMPGPWAFYASGPGFDCAAGPAQSLIAGDNGAVPFAPTTLRADAVPPVGVLWAVSASRATGLATCPTPAQAATAVNVDAARAGDLLMPSGDWFVYRTDGAAAGACLGVPAGNYPKALTYGEANVIAWSEALPKVTLRVTNAANLGTSSGYQIILTRTPVVGNCTTTTPAGAVPLPTVNSSTAQGPVDQGRWYVYRHQFRGGGTGNRCAAAAGNPYVLGAGPSYTLRFNAAGVTP
ncbi:type IV pilus modification PilV family protein [Cellulomonas shaoxiangyii]|uniref:Type II secretion system protein n=1 Tax=Cellulomonas shaoxiangyii TaxID=2566013 RepID=A0A4V1CMP3_9CELL|nr:type II secretion system protein [Cellulomonas shaoxiangyii]QCB93645.1 type II secretion system protein [Cellulomonas shaoxiangyii]TGY84632.1 type II secretion system protein [Cellulomonas shaoxiangyii]